MKKVSEKIIKEAQTILDKEIVKITNECVFDSQEKKKRIKDIVFVKDLISHLFSENDTLMRQGRIL